MRKPASPSARQEAAIALLRQLRRLDAASGVKHSGIAFDIGLLLFEGGEGGLSVGQISARTGYTGPTVRLVLSRLAEAEVVMAEGRAGRTQSYRLTRRGMQGFGAYVEAVWDFAARAAPMLAPDEVSGEAAPAPAPDRPGDRKPPRGRRGGARPGRRAPE